MYLLDTNVISQLARPRADAGVLDFLNNARAMGDRLFLSALTIGEIRKGIDKLRRRGDEDQAGRLQRWLAGLKADYAESILPIDSDTGEIWGAILSATDDTNAIDKLIAATALQYDLTLVTRNTMHVVQTGVAYLDPFQAL